MPCSGLTIHTADGRNLLARTMDFDINPGARLMMIPRGWPVQPSGAFPELIESRYAQLAMGIMAGDLPLTLDGVNEHGLCCALFYYPGFARYEETADGRTPLDPARASQLTLATCKDLDETERLLRDEYTLIAEPSPVLGVTPPLHYMFTDVSGETMIVEPDADGLKIYRNTVGVLTNAPGYLWQETNLRNYLGVNREPLTPVDLESRELTPISPRAALWGLPGDYTSVSRFVRVACLKRFIRKPRNENEGVTAAFHVLSALDVPQVELAPGEAEATFTMYTAVLAANSKSYYFHTYDNRRVQAVSLENENPDAAEIKHYMWHDGQDVLAL